MTTRPKCNHNSCINRAQDIVKSPCDKARNVHSFGRVNCSRDRDWNGAAEHLVRVLSDEKSIQVIAKYGMSWHVWMPDGAKAWRRNDEVGDGLSFKTDSHHGKQALQSLLTDYFGNSDNLWRMARFANV